MATDEGANVPELDGQLMIPADDHENQKHERRGRDKNDARSTARATDWYGDRTRRHGSPTIPVLLL